MSNAYPRYHDPIAMAHGRYWHELLTLISVCMRLDSAGLSRGAQPSAMAWLDAGLVRSLANLSTHKVTSLSTQIDLGLWLKRNWKTWAPVDLRY